MVLFILIHPITHGQADHVIVMCRNQMVRGAYHELHPSSRCMAEWVATILMIHDGYFMC